MSRTDTVARARVQAWKALGAPSGAASALVLDDQGLDLARAVAEVLKPKSLILAHEGPAPGKAAFQTTPQDLLELAADRPAAFDLVLMSGLNQGALSDIAARVSALRDLLAPGGVLGVHILTLGAPDAESGHEALLFPQMVRTGELGEELQNRAPLPASAWRLLIQASGLQVLSVDEGNQSFSEAMLAQHGVRLKPYDLRELCVPDLFLIASRHGEKS